MTSFSDWLLAIGQIVFVNVVLSGDNALVIAMTAQQLPAPLRRKAILWGSGLAVVLQVVFAILVGQLLDIPGLRLGGAIALILIARKLAGEAQDEPTQGQTSRSALGAVLAIVVANLAMSFDNVLAVGALSHGMPQLIAVGILVSAVMLLAASSLVVALIERFRWVTYAGAAVLACTAAGMVCEEPLLADALGTHETADFRGSSRPLTESEGSTITTPEVTVAGTPANVSWLTGEHWKIVIYLLALSLCFGDLRWWTMIRRFESERALSDATPIQEFSEA